jgi:Phosphatidylinositol-4-phosphate 5-Kinase
MSGGAEAILPNEEFLERKRGLFTSEEGGFNATNPQDIPTGDIIYYFGVIDLLTTVLPLSTTTNEKYGVKKRLETFFKSFSSQRDQLSPIPPDEYAARFVKFIRANIHARQDEQQPSSPLTTIEELEDRRFLERAQEQLRKESTSKRKSKIDEVDVSRVNSLVSKKKPEQIVPNVIVESSSPDETETPGRVDGSNGLTSSSKGKGKKADGNLTFDQENRLPVTEAKRPLSV